MRKPLTTRILGLAFLYCVVFFILVLFQFSNKGNFSLSAGSMNIKGRYLSDDGEISGKITGGVKVFYEGIEFNLREERGKGMIITGEDSLSAEDPDSILITETSARFSLPGGTVLVFNSLNTARGAELQITADFADNVSEVSIPIMTRRSSLVRDNEQVGVFFSGSRYFFNTSGNELENGRIVLSRENSFISYRERGKQKEFIPSDYIIEQAQNYDTILRNWQNSTYTYWSQNAAYLQNEDDISAFLSEAIPRGTYTSAVNTIAPALLNTSRHSYRSGVYTGGTINSYNTFIAAENEKINLITRLTREKSLAVFKEEYVLDYLFSRGYNSLAYEIIEIINNAEDQPLISDYCAGLLESFYDFRRWSPESSISHLTEHILHAISDSLHHDTEDNSVFVSVSEGDNARYSLRLGKALIFWIENYQTDTNETLLLDEQTASDWLQIGKSLVLSAISGSTSGKYHSLLRFSEYNPKAMPLTDNGHWAWTASPFIRMTTAADGNMTISFSFPTNMAHYIILRGIRPFLRIQIHGVDWRSDPQFERYDSSGWTYYTQEQVLVLKLRHRSSTENIRLIYREAPRPLPPPPPSPAAGETVE